jgi:hypothetical protein
MERAMQPSKAKLHAIAVMLAAFPLAALAQRPAAPGGDYLTAVNESGGTVRLELLSAGAPQANARAQMMACLAPKAAVRWELGSDPAAANGIVRLQMMRGDTCDEQQPVVCEHSLPRAPGLRHVALRGEGGRCGVSLAAAPPVGLLKAGPCNGPWVPLTISNQNPNWGLWATLYESTEFSQRKILYAACWKPGETRMACVDQRNYVVRAEMTGPMGNESVARNCSGPVKLDTQPGGPDSYGRLDGYRNASVTLLPVYKKDSWQLTMKSNNKWDPIFCVQGKCVSQQ